MNRLTKTSMFRVFISLIVVLTTANGVLAQKAVKEKFTGEERLTDCLAEIPLYYSTKAQQELKAAAEKYKDTEIVLVTAEKNGNAAYTYYYLVGHESSYGPSASLIKTESYHSNSPNKSELFLQYKPKIHSFYNAKCFREKIGQHSDLSQALTEEK